MRRLTCVLLWLATLLPSAAWADETVEICYNYSCLASAPVVYSEADLERLRLWMLSARDAPNERRILAAVMGKLYTWAGQQSPISADQGGDLADDGVEGRMDCIDHATSTTRLLHALERRGWLRFHRVLDQVRRTSFLGVLQHFSAAIEEKPGRLEDWQLSLQLKRNAGAKPHQNTEDTEDAAHKRFVVDTWFHENGAPAVVMPLQEWLDGGGPDV